MRKRDNELSKGWGQFVTPLSVKTSGGDQKLNCANTEGIFRMYTPLEVKWTANPALSDIKHLEVFLSEYKSTKPGFLICQVTRKAKLSEKVFALPWQSIREAFGIGGDIP